MRIKHREKVRLARRLRLVEADILVKLHPNYSHQLLMKQSIFLTALWKNHVQRSENKVDHMIAMQQLGKAKRLERQRQTV